MASRTSRISGRGTVIITILPTRCTPLAMHHQTTNQVTTRPAATLQLKLPTLTVPAADEVRPPEDVLA